jgi:hypothetical protein
MKPTIAPILNPSLVPISGGGGPYPPTTMQRCNRSAKLARSVLKRAVSGGWSLCREHATLQHRSLIGRPRTEGKAALSIWSGIIHATWRFSYLARGRSSSSPSLTQMAASGFA